MPDSPWKKFERLVAERFSKWMAQGAKGVDAERILSRQALMGRMIERTYGDLTVHPKCSSRFLPMAKWFMEKFQVDAKNRKAFRLPGLLTGAEHPFWGWWEKLTEETPRWSRIMTRDGSSGKVSTEEKGKVRLMVIMNAPSKEHLLVLGYGDTEFLDSAMGLMDREIPTIRIRRVKTADAVKIVVLEDFLNWADPVSMGCPKIEEGSNAAEKEIAPSNHPVQTGGEGNFAGDGERGRP
jgi:hypothetical protein